MHTSFSVVPVLDLKAGQVVRAVAGDRTHYQPIRSTLAASSEPAAVLDGLLTLAPFARVYVADLDAITRAGDHRRAIADLAARHEAVEFWVDAGFATASDAIAAAAERIVPVLGSESLETTTALGEAIARLGAGGVVLSLDFRGERFVGPGDLGARPDLWPDRVIAMTLGRVGTGMGPDVERLAALVPMIGDRSLFAAGGVRGRADLLLLAQMGVRGALVASALHDATLGSPDLAGFQGNR
jgi:phosphoribosylformimino-5-aminoimidazole carboxamide ribotide isomerase